jgi:hypothetical protein
VLGWFLVAPLVRLVVKVAFHRSLPGPAHKLSKVLGAGLVAVIVYACFPFGLGWGGGGGGGSGTGGGVGSGKDKYKDGGNASGKTDKGARDKKDASATKPELEKKKLVVELITSARYYEKRDDPNYTERYYLLNGAEQPSKLADVEKYLKEHRSELGGMDILIYANSIADADEAVAALRKLAETYDLPLRVPEAYKKKMKPAGPG